MILLPRIFFLLLSLYLIVVVVVAAAATDEEEQQKQAARRLLQTSLGAPNADVQDVLHDAKQAFAPHVLDWNEILQIAMEHDSKSQPPARHDGHHEQDDSSIKAQHEVHDDEQDEHHVEDDDDDDDDDMYPSYFADRHIRRMKDAHLDYDCMEKEFDLSSDDFDLEDAARVFFKCRIVVLRNVWNQTTITNYKIQISNYISNLHEGYIDAMHGTTTTGTTERLYVRRNKKRFDVVLPMYLRNADIMVQPQIREFLSIALGPDYIVNTVGCVMGEPGAPAGSYHYDDEYLLGMDSLHEYGLAGTDLPPFAMSMFFPLLDTTLQHGPTEFCVGTNHYKGLLKENENNNDMPVKDPSLLQDPNFRNLQHFEETKRKHPGCPPQNRRIPTPQLGDAVLFDYTITHRGGANTSPDNRAMPYIMYSRDWYRDSNFMRKLSDNPTLEEELTRQTRFALVDELHDCEEPPCPERVPLESIHDFLQPAKLKQAREKDGIVVVENVNVEGATLWVGGSKLADADVGSTLQLSGIPPGSKLELWNADQELVHVYNIKVRQERILLRKESAASGSLDESIDNETVEEL